MRKGPRRKGFAITLIRWKSKEPRPLCGHCPIRMQWQDSITRKCTPNRSRSVT
ncbi:hypothetical protein BHE74_00044416 [Ensete ventricosum]|nr:hypothetical protein GW17_00056710 [Ensete ventricosum]RWW49427.1 hypothetical protein BHE74_00044416 [Ensete ventricosum]